MVRLDATIRFDLASALLLLLMTFQHQGPFNNFHLSEIFPREEEDYHLLEDFVRSFVRRRLSQYLWPKKEEEKEEINETFIVEIRLKRLIQRIFNRLFYLPSAPSLTF